MRNAARVAAGAGEPSFEVGDLRVDLAARRVFVRGEEVRLTRTEYNLLATLVKHAGKVVTHRQLLREVWGPGATGESHYLRVYMGQLRHKLEEDPARPRYLLTETGVGYRLRRTDALPDGTHRSPGFAAAELPCSSAVGLAGALVTDRATADRRRRARRPTGLGGGGRRVATRPCARCARPSPSPRGSSA